VCHVLVIEDEPLIAMLISDVALDAGASTIDVADCPVGAMEAADQHRPAVILSDVAIIDGTGPQAVIAIREKHGPIPVIFITATPDACEPCDYATAILPKPMNVDRLTSAFRAVAPA